MISGYVVSKIVEALEDDAFNQIYRVFQLSTAIRPEVATVSFDPSFEKKVNSNKLTTHLKKSNVRFD